MKQRIKIMIIVLIMMSGLISLSGCKNKEEDKIDINKIANESTSLTNIDNNAVEELLGETKINKIFDNILLSKPVYIKYKIKVDEGFSEMEDAIVTYAMKDEMIYMDTVTSSNRATILQTSDKVYTIAHDTKTYVEFSRQNEMQIDNIIDKKITEKPNVKKGKETLYGTEYEYEELHSDGEYNRFYFIKGTDTLKYWKLSDGQLLEMQEYGNEIDNAWFEIPLNYKKDKVQGYKNEITNNTI